MLSGRNLNSFFTVFGRNEVVDQMGWAPAHMVQQRQEVLLDLVWMMISHDCVNV